MLIIILSILILFKLKNSPIKTSIIVCILSIVVRIICYCISKSVFPSACIIISFSSGIIIMFSYCASTCNYEASRDKNNKTSVIIAALMFRLIIRNNETNNYSTWNLEKSFIITSSINLLILIIYVVLIMCAINFCLLSPRKKIIKTY